METEPQQLRAAVATAVEMLSGTADPVGDRVQTALAVLTQALMIPADALPEVYAIEDTNSVDLARPRPRSLSIYREERGMTIPQFTAFLGIAHFEYAHVVHRQQIDSRLRDQIAYRLGVPWQATAELVPEALLPQPVPIPATVFPRSRGWRLCTPEKILSRGCVSRSS